MSSLLTELKRRNVFRVGIAYAVAAWLSVQIADPALQVAGAEDWVLRAIVVVLALGFLPVLIFAWAFELTPEGIKRERDVARDQSITSVTAKKLDVVTIGLLVVAISLMVFRPQLEGLDEAAKPVAETASTESQSANPAEGTTPSTESTGTASPADLSEAPARSIAVLPFANRSNQNDDLYFTDGIHDDLLTQLAKVGDLTVISRTSVMEYRDSPKNIRTIANELNVATVLEGGVQKVGDRVRINAQLIEASSDKHLWAETFDRELTAENIFELQSEIARSIVTAVAGTLTPEEEKLLADVPTHSLAAYDAYLRARVLFLGANYAHANAADARPLAERAIELDPDYAEAHALLADIYGDYYWRGLEQSEEFIANYRATVDRVNVLKPGSALALITEANYQYRVESNYPRSLELLQQAQQIAPGDSQVLAGLGFTQRRLGQWDAAIGNLKRALALDPGSRLYQSTMLETLYGNFRFQDVIDNTVSLEDADRNEADTQIVRALAQFQLTGDLAPLRDTLAYITPTASTLYLVYSPVYHLYQRDPQGALAALEGPAWQQALAQEWQTTYLDLKYTALNLLGETEEARQTQIDLVEELDKVAKLPPQDRIYGYLMIATAWVRLGDSGEAHSVLATLDELLASYQDAVVMQVYLERSAMIYAMLGEEDEALERLRLAMATGGTNNPVTALTLSHDPNWDFFRNNPAFAELSTPDLGVLQVRP